MIYSCPCPVRVLPSHHLSQDLRKDSIYSVLVRYHSEHTLPIALRRKSCIINLARLLINIAIAGDESTIRGRSQILLSNAKCRARSRSRPTIYGRNA